LPKSAELRGVVPLIDPAVGGQAVQNANSAKSIKKSFNAAGLSVAQVMVAQGFSNFTAVDVAGNKVAASTLGGATAGGSNGAGSSGVAVSSVAPVASTAAGDCVPSTIMVTVSIALNIQSEIF
jgi:hypothetical protein